MAPIPQNEPDDGGDEPEEPADPFAIPEVIDADYVQRVLDELLPLVDEAERAAVDAAPSAMPPEETMVVYRAVHSPRLSTVLLTDLSTRLGAEDSAEQYRQEVEEFGSTRWVVTDVGDADEQCIQFRFDYEFSGTEVDQEGVASLLPQESGRDPQEVNPTPWMLAHSGVVGETDEDLDGICAAALQREEEFAEEDLDELEDLDEEGHA